MARAARSRRCAVEGCHVRVPPPRGAPTYVSATVPRCEGGGFRVRRASHVEAAFILGVRCTNEIVKFLHTRPRGDDKNNHTLYKNCRRSWELAARTVDEEAPAPAPRRAPHVTRSNPARHTHTQTHAGGMPRPSPRAVQYEQVDRTSSRRRADSSPGARRGCRTPALTHQMVRCISSPSLPRNPGQAAVPRLSGLTGPLRLHPSPAPPRPRPCCAPHTQDGWVSREQADSRVQRERVARHGADSCVGVWGTPESPVGPFDDL